MIEPQNDQVSELIVACFCDYFKFLANTTDPSVLQNSDKLYDFV